MLKRLGDVFCNFSCVTSSALLVLSLQLSFTQSTYSAPVDHFPAVTDPVAGTIQGAFDVSDFGVATYSMKLSVPPGTAGMAPELSLNYGGDNLRGVLGPKWTLAGLTSVSRCPGNLGLDGNVDPVDFDGNDKFCLDGQRLVAVTGSYGANGTVYRTSTETFTRVTSYGQIGSGPERWVVEYKNGLTAEVGFNADARAVTATSTTNVLTWYVTRMLDRSGNTYSVQYVNDAPFGDVVPLRIDYTANTNAGLAPYNSVQFEYHVDPIAHSNFVGGSNFWSRLHLSNVKMFEGSNLAWTYNMQWQTFNDTQREQLVGVQECGGSGQCLPATTFEWYNTGGAGLDFQNPYTASILSEQNGFYGGDDFPLVTGDWNGDGRTDIARAQGGTVFLYVSTGTGWVPYSSYFTGPSNVNGWTWKHYPLFAGDWNGDGITDIGRATENTRLTMYNITANGAIEPFQAIQYPGYIIGAQPMRIGVGIFGGMQDGRNGIIINFGPSEGAAEVWGETPGSAGTWVKVGSSFQNSCPVSDHSATRIGDWNGDGLTDIAIAGYLGTCFFISHGSHFTHWYTMPDFGEIQGYTGNSTDIPFIVGDWNGDGLSDVARIRSSGIKFCRSLGNSVGACTNSPHLGGSEGYSNAIQHPLIVADFNRDGITDIGRVGNGAISFYKTQQIHNGTINLTSTLPDLSPPTFSPGSEYPMAVGDFNGDGLPDLARLKSNGLVTYLRYPNLIGNVKKITNGLGFQIDLEYKNLTDSTVYIKGSSASYPEFDIQPQSFVVSKATFTDSSGSLSSLSYNYRSLRGSHGGGLVGFEYIDEISDEGMRTRTWYHQTGDFQGLPYKIEVTSPTGQILSRKNDVWAKHQPVSATTFPFIASSVEQSWDLNSSSFGSVTTNNTYDPVWGNLTAQTVNRSDGSFEKTINNFNNDTTTWLIGTLLQSTVSKRLAYNTTETDRHISFDYNSLGLVTTEWTEKDNTSFEQRKGYTYDQFGNILSTVHSAVNTPSRTETKEYDTYGRFVTKIINPLGQYSTFEYDPRHGLVTKATDPNGLVAETVYDDYGRAILSESPEGLLTRKLNLSASGVGGPSGSAYYERVDSDLGPATFTYFDSQGREIQKRNIGFDGREIRVDRAYDDRGNLTHVSDPYFVGDPIQWTVYEYDLLDRVITETAPGNRVTINNYNGLTTTVVNPLNQTSTQVVDQLGLLQSSTDHYGYMTTYKYTNHGDMNEVRDAVGNTTTMSYDLRGRLLQRIEPNIGNTTYTYDGFGQLLTQTNSLNLTITFNYDLLGRIVSRLSPEGVETWQYDSAPHGIGKLALVSGLNGYQQSYDYDALSRLVQTTTTINGANYSTIQSYDSLGRPKEFGYPSGFTIEQSYNQHGYLNSIVRKDTSAAVWTANNYNAKRQLEAQSLGNGLITNKTFDVNTGFLTKIKTGTVQDLSFTFNEIGNLTERQDLRIGARENFQYDNLNRVTQAQVTFQGAAYTPTTVTYDPLGNILTRSDVGTYLYGENGAGPHAVTTITGIKPNAYTYDQVGNRISSNNGTAEYNSLSKVTALTKGLNRVEFDIGPDDQRFEERIYKNGQLLERKAYIGKLFEKILRGISVEDVHYISSPDGLVAIYSKKSSLPQPPPLLGIGRVALSTPSLIPSSSFKYVLSDHLGSIQTITNELGQILEVLSFDSWGNRRDSSTWGVASGTLKSSIDRGFTGHEQLDEVGLVHMNGRVYDPAVGRFLSADPYVQSISNMQSLNRYSYVLNNPLSLTDPTGYFSFKKFWKKATKFLKMAVKIGIVIGVAYTTGLYLQGAWGTGFFATVGNGVVTGVVSSATSSVVNGGSLAAGIRAGIQGAPLNAFTAALSFNIGQAFKQGGNLANKLGDYTNAARAVTHGLAGGTTSMMSGGKFLNGFVTSGTAGFTESSGNGLLTSLASGTAAALTGGKFEEGAIRGAFVYLYNHNTSNPSNQSNGPLDLIQQGLEWVGVNVTQAYIIPFANDVHNWAVKNDYALKACAGAYAGWGATGEAIEQMKWVDNVPWKKGFYGISTLCTAVSVINNPNNAVDFFYGFTKPSPSTLMPKPYGKLYEAVEGSSQMYENLNGH